MIFTSRKLLFVLIHVMIWTCLFLYPFIFHYIPFSDHRAILRIGLLLFFLVLFFYFNSYFLIPHILARKKVVFYFLSVALGVVLVAFGAGYIQVFFNPEYNIKPGVYNRSFNTGIITSLLIWIVSTIITLTREWFRNQQRMKEIETEKLNAELNFLRSQIHPHFLFNALNNIYALENKKSPATGTAILLLSDLVRYLLYETSSDYVSLQKELDYLKNYIELQKLGLNDKVKVILNIEGTAGSARIRPMLIIPIIENMFKHGISYAEPTALMITIKITKNNLSLIAQNPVKEKKAGSRNSGIGIANLRKRLELLYPGKHELKITAEDGIYHTQLNLEFE